MPVNIIKSILLVSMFFLNFYQARTEGGSNYSVFGIGDLQGANGAFYQGLGGTSIALPSEDAINFRNPALWGLVSKTRLQVGYRFIQLYISQGNESLFQNNGSVDAIAGIFSVDTSVGISISFGLVPYSHVDYLNINPIKLFLDGMEVQGKSTYQGKGGLTNGYLGMSYQLFDGLYLGASAFANFGSLSSSIKTVLYDAHSIETITLRDDNYMGSGLRAGIYYQLGSLGLGAFYEKQINFKVKSQLRYYYLVDADTTLIDENKFTLPDAYGFGASLRTGKFLIGADIMMQDYTGFGYQIGPKAEFKDFLSANIGVQRTGSKLAGTKYLDKVDFNFGMGFKQLYYRVLGKDINEFYGSFGMSMPLLDNTKLDWALVIGNRGTTDSGLINETFGSFIISISIGEVWFKPFRRYYE